MTQKCYKFTRDVNFPQKGPDGKTPNGFTALPGDTITQIAHTTYQFSDGYKERELTLTDQGIETMLGHGWLEEIGVEGEEGEEQETSTDPYEIIAAAQAQIAQAQAAINQATANKAISKAAALRPANRSNTPTAKPVPTPQAPRPVPPPARPVVPAPTPKPAPRPLPKPIGKVVAPAAPERTSPILESALGEDPTQGHGQLSEAEAVDAVLSRVKRVNRPRTPAGSAKG